MHCNDESKPIFVEEDIKNKTKTLYFVNYYFKSRIIFEETSIVEKKNLFDDDKKLTIVTLEIRRNFGKEMTNTFKFTFGDNIDTKDDFSNVELLKTYESLLKAELLKTFNNIITTSVNVDKSWQENEKIFWKDVLTDGVYVWRSRFKYK